MTGRQRIWQKKKHSTVKLNALAESLFYCVLTFQKLISDVFKLNAHQPFLLFTCINTRKFGRKILRLLKFQS